MDSANQYAEIVTLLIQHQSALCNLNGAIDEFPIFSEELSPEETAEFHGKGRP